MLSWNTSQGGMEQCECVYLVKESTDGYAMSACKRVPGPGTIVLDAVQLCRGARYHCVAPGTIVLDPFRKALEDGSLRTVSYVQLQGCCKATISFHTAHLEHACC